jgi:hypothetical protein
VIVVCCQVEVSATGWSLVQRSPTGCGASFCVIEKPLEWGGPAPLGAVTPNKKKFIHVCCQTLMKIKWLRLRGEETAFCKLADGGLIPVWTSFYLFFFTSRFRQLWIPFNSRYKITACGLATGICFPAKAVSFVLVITSRMTARCVPSVSQSVSQSVSHTVTLPRFVPNTKSTFCSNSICFCE